MQLKSGLFEEWVASRARLCSNGWMRNRFGVAFFLMMCVSGGAAFGQAAQEDRKKEKKVVVETPLSKVWNSADRASAATRIQAVILAIKMYETDYGILPIGKAAGEKPISTGADFIDILSGVDADQNPKQTVYIEGRAAKKAAKGKPVRSGFIDEGNGSRRLVDPWGNEYAVMLDADDDKEIEVPGLDDPIRAFAVCWSYGKPKDPKAPKSAKKNPPKDWVASWAPEKKKKPGGLFKFGKAKPQKQLKTDFQIFRAALNVYRINAGTYPTTEQGLGALVKKPTVGRIPKRWEQTLKKPQLDPWGREYHYRFPPTHNKGEPDIWSAGKDGVDGTEDDVGNW